MDYNKLAELLFPHITTDTDEIETRYPERNLPEGAKVTRFAPSPTGFVHLGGMYQSLLNERLAHLSGGLIFLRIEDTDSKREVEGASEALIRTLADYGVNFDEGALRGGEKGAYGPYRQSLRKEIYQSYAKKLVREGKAYPVFTTREELERLNSVDKKAEIQEKDWHADNSAEKAALERARNITPQEAEKELAAGNPFVLRVRADGNPDNKVKITDLIKGNLELPENEEDFVLLKSDGIPTYHFAHAVDDHLMHTTHVVRGEEWLPSLPKHIMLFKYLGFRMPKYLHTAQIMRLDEDGNKKKLSKRDMGANMDDYSRLGYPPQVVIEYLMTLLNSNYEEWHMQNPDRAYTDFPFSIKKMSTSGALFDTDKLNDVAKNIVCRMSADEVYTSLTGWAKRYESEFAERLERDRDYAIKIISIGRGGKKPRKDYGTWREACNYMSLFYDETFSVISSLPEGFDKSDVKAALDDFAADYEPDDDRDTWFNKIKQTADKLGYASDMKKYKADPSAYKGSVADISMFIRIAVTGKTSSPDLYDVMHILGSDRMRARIENYESEI